MVHAPWLTFLFHLWSIFTVIDFLWWTVVECYNYIFVLVLWCFCFVFLIYEYIIVLGGQCVEVLSKIARKTFVVKKGIYYYNHCKDFFFFRTKCTEVIRMLLQMLFKVIQKIVHHLIFMLFVCIAVIAFCNKNTQRHQKNLIYCYSNGCFWSYVNLKLCYVCQINIS